MSKSHLPNLDKIFKDDEESDFQPTGHSNLATIFGAQMKEQENLVIAASSKQASKKVSSLQNNVQVDLDKREIIIAKAVYAFKLQDGKYISADKIGLALTGIIPKNFYQIILYKNKQQHLSVATITQNFSYTVQLDNYASFYDSHRINWSIRFDNNESSIVFAREIGFARYFTKQNKEDNDIIFQDLTVGSKHSLAQERDYVTIKYFMNTKPVQPYKISPILSQTMKVEISTDDTWEKTLIGTSEGLRRILYLSPSKQISLGPGFPKEMDIVLEIEIIEIQKPNDLNSSEIMTVQEPNTRDKSSLLVRMAKMGQSMLPKTPSSVTTDSEDTEGEVPSTSIRHRKTLEDDNSQKYHSNNHVKYTDLKRSKVNNKSTKTEVPLNMQQVIKPLPSQWTPPQSQLQCLPLEGPGYSLSSHYPAHNITGTDPNFNIFLSENRIAHTELRMGMSKITDNVQKLLDKFHNFELQNASSSDRGIEASLKMLAALNHNQSSLKTIVQQNENNEKSFVSEEEVSNLREELKKAKETIYKYQERIDNLTRENENLGKLNMNYKQFEENSTRLSELLNYYEKRNEDLQLHVDELNRKYNKLLEIHSDKTSDNLNVMKTKEVEKFVHALHEKFSDGTVFSKNDIVMFMLDTLKELNMSIVAFQSESSNNKSNC